MHELSFWNCGCRNIHCACYNLLVHFFCQLFLNFFNFLSALIAVLEVGDGVFEVLSTSGDTHLGGDDFDKVGSDLLISLPQKPVFKNSYM